LKKIVKPYNDSGSKKEQVAEMFNNIAPTYDLNNKILSLGIDRIWRKILVNTIKKHNPRLILDVATGTGDVAINLIKHIPDARVEGVDISEGMLSKGRKKLVDLKLNDKINLNLGDSENLNFADNTFDAVTIAFGVRNFENLSIGLAEILRVLKPGGIVSILEFSKPANPAFSSLYNFYFKKILPGIGRITSKDNSAYTYLYESVQVFPEGENFVKILESTGYQKSKCRKLSFGICSLYTAFK
jgi:demethylmenaquinone methyltransferase/2-methoxy-6-polyprenyl-1,4-benzoquinol methylase